MDIQKILEVINEKNLSIKDLKISDIVPNVVEDVVINVKNNECETYLPSSMMGENLKRWRKSRGGIFLKDIKKFFSGIECGHYVLLEGEGDKFIARLIEDSELEVFKVLNLIDGRIKDKAYMILRNIKNGETLTKTDRYIEQTKEELDNLRIVINNHISSDFEDSFDHKGNTLFDD